MNQIENKKNLFALFEPFIIIVFWILLFASPLFLGDELDWMHVFKIWKSFIPYLILFIINHFVLLPFVFFRNHVWIFILLNILTILIIAFGVSNFPGNNQQINEREMRHEQEFRPGRDFPPPHAMNRNMRRPGPPPKQLPPYLSFMIISVLIIGFDTGLKLSVKWVHSERQRIHAEKKNVESQLAFLRNQVSPHFFMNTLNNIHSLINFDAEEARESIIRLSKLMRHLLYDSEVEMIPIQKEFEFIRNYVDLMKLRYPEKVKIELHFDKNFTDCSIPPLLFTSFVENAFKYGVSYDQSSFININFSNKKGVLSFTISNSIAKNMENSEQGGIGIENSRRRLDLLYGDRFSLNISEEKELFTVNLNIPL
jgi:hypothetical protein